MYTDCILYLRRVQCFPFQPWEQTQVPFLHWPCSEHLRSHGSRSQRSPVHPLWHSHFPLSQWPWGPQSKLHKAAVGNTTTAFNFRKIYIFKAVKEIWVAGCNKNLDLCSSSGSVKKKISVNMHCSILLCGVFIFVPIEYFIPVVNSLMIIIGDTDNTENSWIFSVSYIINFQF